MTMTAVVVAARWLLNAMRISYRFRPPPKHKAALLTCSLLVLSLPAVAWPLTSAETRCGLRLEDQKKAELPTGPSFAITGCRIRRPLADLVAFGHLCELRVETCEEIVDRHQ